MMECSEASEGPKTAAPFPKKEGRKFFAHVCLQEHSRTFPFVIQVYCIQHHLSVLIYGDCKYVYVTSEIHLLGDPFMCGYGSIVMATRSWRQRKCSSILSDDCWDFKHQCQKRRSNRLADPTIPARAIASLAQN